MNLKLYSMKNDLLELSINPTRPELKIAEIFFDGAYHPWHVEWQKLEIKDFHADFETVKNKIIEYYKAEKESCTLENGATVRKPGRAELVTAEEEWQLQNCKIVDCNIDEDNKAIKLGLLYDGVCYKALGKTENI